MKRPLSSRELPQPHGTLGAPLGASGCFCPVTSVDFPAWDPPSDLNSSRRDSGVAVGGTQRWGVHAWAEWETGEAPGDHGDYPDSHHRAGGPTGLAGSWGVAP